MEELKKIESSRCLTREYKENLYKENKDLIDAIYYYFNGIFVRRQLLTYSVLVLGLNKVKTDILISELVRLKLVSKKSISAKYTTQVYCLNKFLIAAVKGAKRSETVAAVQFNERAILYNIFKIEMALKSQNTNSYLDKTNNRLFTSNEKEAVRTYGMFYNNEVIKPLLTEDFIDDYKLCLYNKAQLIYNLGSRDQSVLDTLKKNKDAYEKFKISTASYDTYQLAQYGGNFTTLIKNNVFFSALNLKNGNVNITIGITDIRDKMSHTELVRKMVLIYSTFNRYFNCKVNIDFVVYTSENGKEFLQKKLFGNGKYEARRITGLQKCLESYNNSFALYNEFRDSITFDTSYDIRNIYNIA